MEEANITLSINTLWVVTAAILVFFMQAGFAMLEGGLVRSKNTVNVIMKNYIDMCFASVAFWAVGYGIMYGTNATGFIGTDGFFPSDLAGWDATVLFYQMMFAATAATIVSGALAERIRYWPYVFAAVFLSSFIYATFGSWAWGGTDDAQGWLRELGFIDFAGSTVVHSIGGWCALSGVILLGPRTGRYGRAGKVNTIPGHNLPLMALGAFILWMGWFGFNGGSALEANASIGQIALNTHLGGAGGVIGVVLALIFKRKPILMTLTINGGLAGLVSVTAGCATVDPHLSLVTGIIGGVLMVLATELLDYLELDDAVGAVPVHGVGGAWGTLAAGMFFRGDLFNPGIIGIQCLGILAGMAWAFGVSFVMWSVMQKFVLLRAEALHEQRGLDSTEHFELGYPEFQRDALHEGVE